MRQHQPSAVELSDRPVRIVVRLLIGNALQRHVLPLELHTSLEAGHPLNDLHLLSVAVTLPGENVVFRIDDSQPSITWACKPGYPDQQLAIEGSPRARIVSPIHG